VVVGLGQCFVTASRDVYDVIWASLIGNCPPPYVEYSHRSCRNLETELSQRLRKIK
jgi:hypothetical protein